MNRVWDVFLRYLYFVSIVFDFEIHAFVLMNNHYHLLARTPLANIDEVMEYFQRETSKQISRENGRINHIYGGPYKASLIRDINHYNNVYRYILRNPIRAGVCQDVLEYPFGSLQGLLGLQRLKFPVFGNEELFYDLESCLKWLNTAPTSEVDESIRKGLRKTQFDVGRDKYTGSQMILPESFKL